ncbi:MAG: sulfite exporter TauE/SafE family protein [Ktedonobacterales bacterium]|nr:sulfite exporter TauE/SafE family protein [Ktedonobacterales bacterium]
MHLPPLTLPQAVGLLLAGVLGGLLNSVAGGGGFIGFPALVFAGVPSIPANATSATALLVGNTASLGAYRRALPRQRLVTLVLVGGSFIGGAVGAILLLLTPPVTFARLVPWLLLFSTLLFALSGPIITRLRRGRGHDDAVSGRTLAIAAVAQTISAVYGGYYGGGNGFIMLAILGLMGMRDIHKMNALRTLLAITLNATAVVIFISAGAVAWPQALTMMVGAVVGGYCGARAAQRIDPARVRLLVIGIGACLTGYFFLRG